MKKIILLSLLSISFTSVHGMLDKDIEQLKDKCEAYKDSLFYCKKLQLYLEQKLLRREITKFKNSSKKEFPYFSIGFGHYKLTCTPWDWDKIERKPHENPDETCNTWAYFLGMSRCRKNIEKCKEIMARYKIFECHKERLKYSYECWKKSLEE